MIDDLRHFHAEDEDAFFIFQECAGSILLVLLALALLFWPWMQ